MSDEDDPADDPQLRSLRAVWLAMPDEDPPQRGLAELMAAARVKADEMAKPSLWDRIVAQLRRPPVLALATVMVLIGGAVLIGNKKSSMEVETTAPTQETAPVEIAPGAGSAAPVTTPEPAAEQAPAAAPTTPPADPASPPPPPKRNRTQPRTDGKATTTGGDTYNYREEGEALRKAEDRELQLRSAPTGNAKASAPAAESIAADGFADTAVKGTAKTEPAGNDARARQYVQKAKSALSRGDCTAAKQAMTTARKLDESVWREAQRDGKLADCVSAAVD